MQVFHPHALCTAQSEFKRDKCKVVHVDWGKKHFTKYTQGVNLAAKITNLRRLQSVV